MLMRWFETCSEFWTDTLQPCDDAIEEFSRRYRVRKWTIARPLWPRRCLITGKWLWWDKHYKVEAYFQSPWWEMPDIHEYVWIEFETGTMIRLMLDT